jgi:P pilus assembly chaperone PapD
MDLQHRHLHADDRFHAQRTLTRTLVCAAALAGALASAAPALAQLSVEVSPLRIELQAAPGGSSTQAITLLNAGKEPVRIRAIVADWYLSKDGAPQFEAPGETRAYSASEWIRVAPPELVLQPGIQGTVRFSLAVPQGVDPAGYRTSILFEMGPAAGDPVARAREVAIKSRIATMIYVNIGQPPAAVDLTDLRVRTTPEQTEVVATLKNSSRRTVRTKGSLLIYGASGPALREVPVPDVPVLPESERDVAIVAYDHAKNPLPPGEYRVEVKIDVGLPALIVGETTLKVPK